MGGKRVERVSPANSGSSSKLRRFGSILALAGQNEIDFSRIAYLDPNPELEKHPMSLEASQSSRESTRYPRDSKPLPGGSPPDRVFCLEDTEWILEKIARLRGSSDAFRAQDLGSSPPVWGTVPQFGGRSPHSGDLEGLGRLAEARTGGTHSR